MRATMSENLHTPDHGRPPPTKRWQSPARA